MDKTANSRKHLTQSEVARLIEATKGGRDEARDRCLLLLTFRHGLQATETCGLRLSQINLEGRVLHVARLKRGLSTMYPLRPDELRAIKAWLLKRGEMGADSDALFLSERTKPLNRRTGWALLRNYSRQAGLAVEVHPHMLRHTCGFALADQGADTRLIQDYLGHRCIRHTVLYTAANPARFGKLW